MVTALLAATVVVRRRWPVAAFSAAAVIGAAQLAFGLRTGAPPPVAFLQPTMTDLAIPVLLYTLAAYRPRRISIAGRALPGRRGWPSPAGPPRSRPRPAACWRRRPALPAWP